MLVKRWGELVAPDDLTAFFYEDWRLVANPAIAAWIKISSWEYDILCGLARKQPSERVIEALAQRFNEPLEAARLRVEKTLGLLLLKWIIYLPESIPHIPKPQPSLKQVYYAITEGCNLRCPYCYASSEKALPGELTPEESLGLVDQVADMGCEEFIITGGEPMLRRDLFDVAARSKARGMGTNMITNGTVIKTREIADRIAELFDLVTVSIDGGTAEIHEQTRGKGTFKAVLRALELLNEAGVEPKINHVVSPQNADYLPALTEMLTGFRIRQVRLMHHGPLGRGAGDGSDLDWSNYMKIHRYTWGDPAARKILPDGPKPPKPGMIAGNCGLGGTEIYINSLGDVYPCKLVTSASFKAGNLRTRPLRDIYSGSATMRDLREISVDTLLGCKTCYIRGGCGGGCRAYHLGYSGNIKVSASRQFCPVLRHQMVSAMWAAHGLTGKPLVQSPTAFEPILVRTGGLYPVPAAAYTTEPAPAKHTVIPLQAAAVQASM